MSREVLNDGAITILNVEKVNEAKAQSNIHRETTVTAPVLDSTAHFTNNLLSRNIDDTSCPTARPGHGRPFVAKV